MDPDHRKNERQENHLQVRTCTSEMIIKLLKGIPAYPNWPHTTLASDVVQWVSHTDLHWLFKHTNTVPSADESPPFNLTSPRVHAEHGSDIAYI